MSKQEYQNIKISTLVSVIVHGASELGLHLAKTLSEQNSKVIVIDQFTKEKKDYVNKLKKLKDVDFIAFEGITDLYSTLSRFDYLFYLQNSYLANQTEFNSKSFLEESNILDQSLKSATKFNAKCALVTSMIQNQKIVVNRFKNDSSGVAPYSAAETQKYSETLAAEFHDKSKLNIRILRAGVIMGPGFDAHEDQELHNLITQSVEKETLTLEGEGLDNHYVVHVEDAIFGIIKLTFDAKTSGEVITLANSKPLTTLSVAYKLLELNTNAQNIKFTDDNDQFLAQEQYVPAQFASEFGWQSKEPIEQAFIDTLSTIYDSQRLRWSNKPTAKDMENVTYKPTPKTKSKNENVLAADTQPKTKTAQARSEKTLFGRIISTITSPFSWVINLARPSKPIKLSWFRITGLFGFTILLLLASYFLITPITMISIRSYQINEDVQRAYANLSTLEIQQAQGDLEQINSDVEDISVAIERLQWAFIATAQQDTYDNLSQLAFAAGFAVEGAYEMSIALEPLATYIDEFEPAIDFNNNSTGTTRQYNEYLEQLQDNEAAVAAASADLNIASSMIEALDTEAFPSRFRPYLIDLKTYNQQVSDIIKPMEQTVKFLPELLGVEERQRYVVLLQNPSELRSTGGWLSSYAVIGIENGQVRQLEVDDIYNIDGQLSLAGEVFEPPQDMQAALDIDKWQMSLVNWDPDFGTVADDTEGFIQAAEVAPSIDGVIAIDVELVRKLLDRWGGIQVAGRNELVTSENLYDILFEIHEEFTPGSTRKTTFIANLADAVLVRLLDPNSGSIKDIADVMYDGLQEKNILLHFENPQANRYIRAQGWSGDLLDEYKGTPIPIEWNWGANKANLYLERTNELEIEVISTDVIRYTFKRSIQNNSNSNEYPEGDYDNYFRVFMPQNIDIKSISGFDTEITPVNENGNFSNVGGWLNVPFGQVNSFEITYTYTRNSDEYFPIQAVGQKVLFDLQIFKQPGISTERYDIDIYYPEAWSLINDADMDTSLSQLSTSTEISGDRLYEIEFEQ